MPDVGCYRREPSIVITTITPHHHRPHYSNGYQRTNAHAEALADVADSRPDRHPTQGEQRPAVALLPITARLGLWFPFE